MQDIETLRQFYDLMSLTRDARADIVTDYLSTGEVDAGQVRVLAEALEKLEAIPGQGVCRRVRLDHDRTIELDLAYEIGELQKDLVFLHEGEEALMDHLAVLHPGMSEHLEAGRRLLGGLRFNCFVTDRDGTINNYCGRYRSSVQSAYNAVFLTRFAERCTRNAVLITSAPLANPGILDVTVTPPGTFIYAASKAREFVDTDGHRHSFPIDPGQRAMIERLNSLLASLVQQPAYEKFSLIGSGLQLKFGQTTIAHQDIARSVPEEESASFVQRVAQVVQEVDPEGGCFALEDTGLDLEIILTISGQGSRSRDFDKGDGVSFLDQAAGLGMDEGPHLVAGDTGSDLRMLEACTARTPDVWCAFVTRDEELAARVRRMSPNSLIVPEPDILVALLGELSGTGGADA